MTRQWGFVHKPIGSNRASRAEFLLGYPFLATVTGYTMSGTLAHAAGSAIYAPPGAVFSSVHAASILAGVYTPAPITSTVAGAVHAASLIPAVYTPAPITSTAHAAAHAAIAIAVVYTPAPDSAAVHSAVHAALAIAAAYAPAAITAVVHCSINAGSYGVGAYTPAITAVVRSSVRTASSVFAQIIGTAWPSTKASGDRISYVDWNTLVNAQRALPGDLNANGKRISGAGEVHTQRLIVAGVDVTDALLALLA